MIRVENIETYGFLTAIRAMRNPYQNWELSDSDGESIGDVDMSLMQRLSRAGVEQRTYARFMQVSMDITAPLYWWKEMDRYTVGKTQISTSTMHTIHKKPFELDDFSWQDMEEADFNFLKKIIEVLEENRMVYLVKKDTKRGKKLWNGMIKLLPSCYNQKRTVMMSYEVCMKIIKERRGHKLSEWGDFIKVLETLPGLANITPESR